MISELSMRVAGGGKAAQSRGGSVRRVLVHDVSLTAEQALSTYVACAQDNPAISGKLAAIQVILSHLRAAIITNFWRGE